MASGIRSLIEAVAFRPIRFFQCSTPKGNTRRKPESSFGENQLLQRSISFSLQPTSHPEMLHNLWVRTSLLISEKFILLMGSSRCFGSDTYDCNPALSKLDISYALKQFENADNQDFRKCRACALFTLAFAAAPGSSPLAKPYASTRWLILQ